MKAESWSLPNDPLGAFCRDNHVSLRGSGRGPLAGLSFAVKDVFHIVGTRTGLGHPDWLATHAPAESTAVAVQRLLNAGADVAGRTVCDELCYSLSGENVHYGAPLNPCNPSRFPGGSSSGSASATAAGLVDFALGSDCGGSVRIPASYCGVLGMRPTHGRVPTEGLVPFASSFDCIGWFARDPEILSTVGKVLLADDGVPAPFQRLLVARDAFGVLSAATANALRPVLEALSGEIGDVREITLAPEGLEDWFRTFRTLQAGEVWATLGEWVEEVRPSFGPGVRERMIWASRVTEAEIAKAQERRGEIVARLAELIVPGDAVVLPTAPQIAPVKDEKRSEIETTYRHQAMSLLCSAGLAGLPQISLPLAAVDGMPIGLSVIARRGADIDLLGLAQRVCGPVAPRRLEGVL